MAKKKQIKKIDDHFFSLLKKTRKELGRNQELGLGKSSLQKTILFFSNIFFLLFLVLSDISSQLFVFYYYFIWLGIFEIRERFKLQKRKKFLDQKIYHSMI